ncbi:uncharacterized protein LOC113516939 [Galleria mellonella]|uniref:XK-related protein n=1 Tax=Galleria mellonella TaxID=7137 RepID=A0A6J1WPM6_GALME|nr:uncharacterized protein LOC113516939 [Galleria mellonella]
MVTCELDKEISGEVLGWKLSAWQALLLHRVVPSCGGLILYLTLICFDFALVYEHFANGEDGLGIFCLILITMPALLSFIFTLASPPPGLETDLSAYDISVEKNDIKWLLTQFANCIFFPIATIGRYCYLIFWWVEVVYACRHEDEERVREALLNARAPSSMELYLFLQSFIHAAPHAIVNILDLMARYDNPAYSKRSIQFVSIIASSLRMASTATMYRRFEREKINGRKYPWSKTKEELENVNNENIEAVNNNAAARQKYKEEPIYEEVTTRKQSEIGRSKLNSDLIQFSPSTTMYYDDIVTDSESSSDYQPGVTMRDGLPPPELESDDEYIRPISIVDRVAPRRSDKHYTIQEVYIPPPPAIPAPRPGSIAAWAERMVENAESIPMWLSAPPRRKYCDEVVRDEPDIPIRVPRSYIRGLEPQDLPAALVHCMGWYAFFVARLLSMAAFINLTIIGSVIILFSHYQVMLLFLIIPQASTVKRTFYFFLAFVYLFCIMEFKIRFRHVRVWHLFWSIVCMIETILFTGLWVALDNNLHHWWKKYVLYVIIVSLMLSITCFITYFVILQPKETIVRIKNRNKITN